MKSKTIPFAFLFVAILIVGAFFLSKSVVPFDHEFIFIDSKPEFSPLISAWYVDATTLEVCISSAKKYAEQDTKKEKKKLKQLPTRLEDALDALEKDYKFLMEGGVFPEELIKNFISRKRAECLKLNQIPHPAEFDRYYNC